jgi:Fe-S-cluster containining protein
MSPAGSRRRYGDGVEVGDAAAGSDLEVLCQSCGLCCDGSLFGRVDLEPEEVESARRHRLRLFPGAGGFEQPCAALARPGSGLGTRSCSIYEERPLSCRRFACRLYERHLREGGPIEERLQVVRRVRNLAAALEASGLVPSDFESRQPGARPIDPRVARAMPGYHELTRSLEEHFARAR